MDFSFLPGQLRRFSESLQQNLTQYNVELRLKENLLSAEQPAVIFEFSGAALTTSIILHQTARSLNSDQPEYRARLDSELPQEFAEFARGKENWVNRFATLSALMVSQDNVEIGCQSLLEEDSLEFTAYIMSLAAMFGAISIIESVNKALSKEKPSPTFQSEWTKSDFEQIHYDCAHLGAGILERESWSFRLLYGELELVSNTNPYWGGGLLALSKYRKKELNGPAGELSINVINQLGYLVDDTPMFGAWCEDEEAYIFVSFFPNSAKTVPNIQQVLVDWFYKREKSIRAILLAALTDD